jgi:hypothetical protein
MKLKESPLISISEVRNEDKNDDDHVPRAEGMIPTS